jgi:hypothetical protein
MKRKQETNNNLNEVKMQKHIIFTIAKINVLELNSAVGESIAQGMAQQLKSIGQLFQS